MFAYHSLGVPDLAQMKTIKAVLTQDSAYLLFLYLFLKTLFWREQF